MSRIITLNESFIHSYEPENKQQPLQWKSSSLQDERDVSGQDSDQEHAGSLTFAGLCAVNLSSRVRRFGLKHSGNILYKQPELWHYATWDLQHYDAWSQRNLVLFPKIQKSEGQRLTLKENVCITDGAWPDRSTELLQRGATFKGVAARFNPVQFLLFQKLYFSGQSLRKQFISVWFYWLQW